MRRLTIVVAVLLALSLALAGGAAAQSPGDGGCGRFVLRANAAGSFDTLCLGDGGAQVAISPDGRFAAAEATRDGRHLLTIIALDGGATAVSVPLQNDQLLDQLVFSPDGTRLAIATSSTAGPHVQVVDAISGVTTFPRLDDRVSAVTDLLWTPDGGQLTAVFADYSIPTGSNAIADLDPSGIQPSRHQPAYGAMCIYGLAWSADGKTLAFTAGGVQNPCGDPALDGVYALDAASGTTTRLDSGIAISVPHWTADGRILVEVGRGHAANTQQVALLGLDGSTTYFDAPRPSACSELPGGAPPQEANGVLLYQAVDSSIVVVNLASGAQQMLTVAGPASLHSPLLSPGGDRLAHTQLQGSGTSDFGSLVRIDAVGGATGAQITIAGATVTLDGWLPDGSGLLARAEPGEHELCPQ